MSYEFIVNIATFSLSPEEKNLTYRKTLCQVVKIAFTDLNKGEYVYSVCKVIHFSKQFIAPVGKCIE